MTQSTEEVYYATPYSVLVLDKDELSTRFLDKTNGLSQATILMVRYHQPTETLIVVYENSVIDLVGPEGTITLTQIKNFTNFTGDKRVNALFVDDSNIAYLAAGYGVSALDLEAGTFRFTTFTGRAVESVAAYEGQVYAGTTEGIYRASLAGANINDFNNWSFLGEDSGLPGDYATYAMAVYKEDLYFGVESDLYRWGANGVSLFYNAADNLRLQYLTAEGEHLLAGYRCAGGGCGVGEVRYFSADGSSGTLATNCLGQTNTAIEDQSGRVWFGDDFNDFRRLDRLTDETCQFFSLNSPYSAAVWYIDAQGDGRMWLATGALDPTLSNRFLDHGFASLENGQWTIFNRWTNEVMRGENRDPSTPEGRSDDLFDVITVAVNPVTEKVYAGSFYEGLLEWDGQEMKLYNEKNSPLQLAEGDPLRVRIGGLAVDEEGNLWISNQNANQNKPIVMLSAAGEWHAFGQQCGQKQLFQLDIDLNGYKWIIDGSGSAGLLVFDEGELANNQDDRCRVLTTSNTNLPNNTTNTLAVDLDGDVWVGTTAGIIIFEAGGDPFSSDYRGVLRIVERDGFAGYLFETESVQAIAVDGANRKWVGTTSGAFLLSPDGEEEIYYFNADNSPLLDNNVRTIAVDPLSGQVFFGTDRGVVSFQGDAVVGRNVNSSNIVVYPNPVRPDYQGSIAIRGLARDANVKITDISGKLVYETQALGGQAIWDGRDYNGRRAQTGVYLVFSTSNPRNLGFGEPDAAVAKIVFIN